MTKRASSAAVAESTSYSVRKMVDGSSSLSSVISMALLHESASILRRFEASRLRFDSLIVPVRHKILAGAVAAFIWWPVMHVPADHSLSSAFC
jgi:hypothetical protein